MDANRNHAMSVNLSIKNASEEVVSALKLRAKRNHRSLQGELMAIIEAAVREDGRSAAQGLRETATARAGRAEAATATNSRERDIQHLMGLLQKGLPLGNRRFTRDEMHER
jgi:plasmid stability protein